MSSETIYFIKPLPDGDYLHDLAKKLSNDGYSLCWTEKEVFLTIEMKQVLLEKGPTNILTPQLLTEEVLPDNSSRDAVLDTLKYKLNRCAPQQSLHIIDPYLYPHNPDSTYLIDFVKIFESAMVACSHVKICTLQNRNTDLEQKIKFEINNISSQITVETKYSNIFHDRFWIADDERGVFVGTSLNGIGRRYAVIDYLQERDAKEIVQRYKQIL